MNKKLSNYDEMAEELVGQTVDYVSHYWSSDWDGDDVGFPDVLIVGLYSIPDQPIYYYVNTENGEVLDAWHFEDY